MGKTEAFPLPVISMGLNDKLLSQKVSILSNNFSVNINQFRKKFST